MTVMTDGTPKLYRRAERGGRYFTQVCELPVCGSAPEDIEEAVERALNEHAINDVDDGDFVLVQWANGNILPLWIKRRGYRVSTICPV